MDEQVVNEIANAVISKMTKHVITAELPKYVYEKIAETAQVSSYQTVQIYLGGSYVIILDITFTPSGKLDMRMRDWNGQNIWHGSWDPDTYPPG